MTKRRNRTKQELPLEERLIAFSDRWRMEAETSEEARKAWTQRSMATEAALGVIEWLASREQRSPR